MKNREHYLRPTSLEHAAKVQLYRWYQLFEREFNEERINHQLEILDNNVVIKSVFGETKGRDGFPGKLSPFEHMVGAHHVNDIQIKSTEEGPTNLNAEVTCQSLHPDGSEKSYAVQYKTKLAVKNGLLPKFVRLDLTTKNVLRDVPFRDAYPANRTKALVHYWLLLLERLDNNVQLFDEILTEEFTLDLGDGAFISSQKELQNWLTEVRRPLKMSCHHTENFSVQQIVKNKYEVYVDFVWHRLTKEDRHLKTTTRQRWIVRDNPNERFARIQWASVVSKKKEEVLS